MSGVARAVRKAMDPEGTRSFPLWFGVLAPPLAWASHLLLGDALYELGCAPGFSVREIYGLPFQSEASFAATLAQGHQPAGTGIVHW